MKKSTREWVRFAEADHHGAQLLGDEPAVRNLVAFHCHQSAEKYLKAILEELGQPIPKTHDLGRLLADISPFHPTVSALKRGAELLTDFAVDSRYPGGTVRKRQVEAAVRWAERVRQRCREFLGLRPPKRHKRRP